MVYHSIVSRVALVILVIGSLTVVKGREEGASLAKVDERFEVIGVMAFDNEVWFTLKDKNGGRFTTSNRRPINNVVPISFDHAAQQAEASIDGRRVIIGLETTIAPPLPVIPMKTADNQAERAAAVRQHFELTGKLPEEFRDSYRNSVFRRPTRSSTSRELARGESTARDVLAGSAPVGLSVSGAPRGDSKSTRAVAEQAGTYGVGATPETANGASAALVSSDPAKRKKGGVVSVVNDFSSPFDRVQVAAPTMETFQKSNQYRENQ